MCSFQVKLSLIITPNSALNIQYKPNKTFYILKETILFNNLKMLQGHICFLEMLSPKFKPNFF